jgi:hypothetical protein
VNVVLAGPGGTFSAPVTYGTTVTTVRGVDVGDLNADGRPDLAFAGWYAVAVRLNNGDGTFAPEVKTATDSGLGGMAILDANLDGWGDVIAASGANRGLAYFQNAGNGTLSSARIIGAGDASAMPTRVIVGDLTGDGRPEVVSFNTHLAQGASLSVYPNGFGYLSTGTQYLPGISGGAIPFGSVSAGAILDFTGDGKADLALIDGENLLLVRGNGTVGGLTYVTWIAIGASAHSPRVADVDGDGRKDLAVAFGGGISLLRGTGTSLAAWKTVASVAPQGLVAQDADGDLDADLLVAGGGFVQTLTNEGAGTFGAPHVAVAGTGSVLAVTDVNRDGFLDLITSATGVGYGRGDGTFSTASQYSVYYPSAAAAADLDCDGDTDVLLGTTNGSLTGLFGIPYSTGFNLATVASGTSPSKGIGSADLDGDGRTDVVLANSDGTASIFKSNCTRTPPRTTVAIPTTTVGIALGDVTGDGLPDLVFLATGAPGFVGVWHGAGDGTFSVQTGTPLPALVTSPKALALGDVDHDGDLDVVTANGATNDVTVLYNAGGEFTTASFATGKAVTSVAVGDVNGDGMPDVVATHNADNLLSVLVTPPGGAGTPTQRQWFVDRPGRVFTAEVNGDGWDDVLFQTTTALGSANTGLLARRCLTATP